MLINHYKIACASILCFWFIKLFVILSLFKFVDIALWLYTIGNKLILKINKNKKYLTKNKINFAKSTALEKIVRTLRGFDLLLISFNNKV
jgi:hypothetical protein